MFEDSSSQEADIVSVYLAPIDRTFIFPATDSDDDNGDGGDSGSTLVVFQCLDGQVHGFTKHFMIMLMIFSAALVPFQLAFSSNSLPLSSGRSSSTVCQVITPTFPAGMYIGLSIGLVDSNLS